MKQLKVVMIDSLVGNDYSIILCNALHKVGTDITLIVTEDRQLPFKETYKIKKWLPSKTKSKSRIVKSLKYFRYLIKLFFYVKKNADVVHFQFFRRRRIESIFFYLLSKSGIKLVHTVHDVVPLDDNKTDRYFNNIVYKASDALIVHSVPNKNTLESMKINPNKIYVTPHGNFDIFLPSDPVTRECARGKLKLSMGADVLLFFGFIKKYKGLDLLLDAFDKASAYNRKLYLVISGAVETEALNHHYLSSINHLDSRNRVIFHNRFIDNKYVQTYFRASDIAILPYKQISHSGVMHLAYTFGLPLLVTDTGDLAYTIEEDKSGYVVPPDNCEAMAAKIIEIFSDKNKLVNMSSHIIDLNKTKYSWENTAGMTKKVYQDHKGS